jgi:type II secretory pathway component PulC
MITLNIKSFVATLNQTKYLNFLFEHKDEVRKGTTLCLLLCLTYICVQLTLSVLANMHKPTIEQTNIAILRSEAQDISAYRNLFGDFHNVAFKEDYKTVKPTRLNLTLIGTIFKEKGALAIIRSSNSKSKVYQKGDNITSGALLKDIAKDYVVIKTGGRLEKILIKFDYIDTKKPHKNKTLDLNSR